MNTSLQDPPDVMAYPSIIICTRITTLAFAYSYQCYGQGIKTGQEISGFVSENAFDFFRVLGFVSEFSSGYRQRV